MSHFGINRTEPALLRRVFDWTSKRLTAHCASMKLDSPEADLLFTALGNETRRRILQRLTEKPVRSISELAREFGISNTAASKHVHALEKSGLTTRTKRGKYHQIQPTATPLLNHIK